MKKTYSPAQPSNATSSSQPVTPATREEVALLIQKISNQITRNPSKAALILKDWIDTRDQLKKTG